MKILIIDDLFDHILLAKKQLSRSFPKAQLAFANGAKEALIKLEESNFDIFIIDIRMPEMSGLDFVKMIKDKKGLKIAYTASLDERQLESFDRLLIKPFPNKWKEIFNENGQLISEQKIWKL